MSTPVIAQVVPVFWDKESTIGGAWYLKKARADERDPTISDPPIDGLESAELQVKDKYGGTLRFPAVECEVDPETGLVSYEIENATVASADWKESVYKLFVTSSHETRSPDTAAMRVSVLISKYGTGAMPSPIVSAPNVIVSTASSTPLTVQRYVGGAIILGV